MKLNIQNYKEIRGTIVKKSRILLGYRFFIRDDVGNTASVIVGKELFFSPFYPIGAKLTVGYIGHQLINIRPGIVANID